LAIAFLKPEALFYLTQKETTIKRFLSWNIWPRDAIYDYRTNIHHTQKKNPMKFSDLEEFISCYHPENHHKRAETWAVKNPEGLTDIVPGMFVL
jgi:hypothetical protein